MRYFAEIDVSLEVSSACVVMPKGALCVSTPRDGSNAFLDQTATEK